MTDCNQLAATFVPTEEMILAAKLVILAKAHKAVIEPIVLTYKRCVLAEGNWPLSQKYTAPANGRTGISEEMARKWAKEPGKEHMLDPEHRAECFSRYREERIKANLTVKHPDNCPLLEADSELAMAQMQLAQLFAPVVNVDPERVHRLKPDEFKKLVDGATSIIAQHIHK